MQKSDEEEQQLSTQIVREVVIMSYNDKYQSYNVYSVNSYVAKEVS